MFLANLFEARVRKVVVCYPGRFQPFHKGHKAVYDNLCQRFGADNVFVVTSDKVEPGKSPFNFAEKKKMMISTGVPADKIVMSTQPYRAVELTQNYDAERTALLFAVSAKDMAEDPRFSFKPKKDGSPSYFQPYNDEAGIAQCEALSKHGYMVTVPTVTFKVLGKPANSATQIRKQFADSDDATQRQIVTDLYGRFDNGLFSTMKARLSESVVVENPEEAASNIAKTTGRTPEQAREIVASARKHAIKAYGKGDENAPTVEAWWKAIAARKALAEPGKEHLVMSDDNNAVDESIHDISHPLHPLNPVSPTNPFSPTNPINIARTSGALGDTQQAIAMGQNIGIAIAGIGAALGVGVGSLVTTIKQIFKSPKSATLDEIKECQRQIRELHKKTTELKTDKGRAKAKDDLRQAYNVLDELKAKFQSGVAEQSQLPEGINDVRLQQQKEYDRIEKLDNLSPAEKEYMLANADPRGKIFKAAYYSFPKGQQAREEEAARIAAKYGVDAQSLMDREMVDLATRLGGNKHKAVGETLVQGFGDITPEQLKREVDALTGEMHKYAREGNYRAVAEYVKKLEPFVKAATTEFAESIVESVDRAIRCADRNRDDIFEV